MIVNEEGFLINLPKVWVGVSCKLPRDQAHYNSPLVHEMERWCANNCKTDFFTVIDTNDNILIRFMCVKSNSCEQATMDATAFKLRWI